MKCPKCEFDSALNSKFFKECGTQLLPAEEVSISHTRALETSKEELTTGSTFAGRCQDLKPSNIMIDKGRNKKRRR